MRGRENKTALRVQAWGHFGVADCYDCLQDYVFFVGLLGLSDVFDGRFMCFLENRHTYVDLLKAIKIG